MRRTDTGSTTQRCDPRSGAAKAHRLQQQNASSSITGASGLTPDGSVPLPTVNLPLTADDLFAAELPKPDVMAMHSPKLSRQTASETKAVTHHRKSSAELPSARNQPRDESSFSNGSDFDYMARPLDNTALHSRPHQQTQFAGSDKRSGTSTERDLYTGQAVFSASLDPDVKPLYDPMHVVAQLPSPILGQQGGPSVRNWPNETNSSSASRLMADFDANRSQGSSSQKPRYHFGSAPGGDRPLSTPVTPSTAGPLSPSRTQRLQREDRCTNGSSYGAAQTPMYVEERHSSCGYAMASPDDVPPSYRRYQKADGNPVYADHDNVHYSPPPLHSNQQDVSGTTRLQPLSPTQYAPPTERRRYSSHESGWSEPGRGKQYEDTHTPPFEEDLYRSYPHGDRQDWGDGEACEAKQRYDPAPGQPPSLDMHAHAEQHYHYPLQQEQTPLYGQQHHPDHRQWQQQHLPPPPRPPSQPPQQLQKQPEQHRRHAAPGHEELQPSDYPSGFSSTAKTGDGSASLPKCDVGPPPPKFDFGLPKPKFDFGNCTHKQPSSETFHSESQQQSQLLLLHQQDTLPTSSVKPLGVEECPAMVAIQEASEVIPESGVEVAARIPGTSTGEQEPTPAGMDIEETLGKTIITPISCSELHRLLSFQDGVEGQGNAGSGPAPTTAQDGNGLYAELSENLSCLAKLEKSVSEFTADLQEQLIGRRLPMQNQPLAPATDTPNANGEPEVPPLPPAVPPPPPPPPVPRGLVTLQAPPPVCPPPTTTLATTGTALPSTSSVVNPVAKNPGEEFAEKFFADDPNVKRESSSIEPAPKKMVLEIDKDLAPKKRAATIKRFTTAQSRLAPPPDAASSSAERGSEPGKRTQSPSCESSRKAPVVREKTELTRSRHRFTEEKERKESSSGKEQDGGFGLQKRPGMEQKHSTDRTSTAQHGYKWPKDIAPVSRQSWADAFFTTDILSAPSSNSGEGDQSPVTSPLQEVVKETKMDGVGAEPSTSVQQASTSAQRSSKSSTSSKVRYGKESLKELLTKFQDTYYNNQFTKVTQPRVGLEEGEVSDSDEEGEYPSFAQGPAHPVSEAASAEPVGTQFSNRAISRIRHKKFMERISTEKQRLHTECEERRRQEKKDLLTRDASGKVFAHADLWSNVPGQNDRGPVCTCTPAEKKSGIMHGIYSGEERIPPCQKNSNNHDRLYAYKVEVSPLKNFATSSPTSIVVDDVVYEFDGFLLLAHEDISKVSATRMIRFHIEYTISLEPVPLPENFTVECLDVFEEFLFYRILELFDWNVSGDLEDSCPRFHFYPRFVPANASRRDGPIPVLSMDQVLKHLLTSFKPLYDPNDEQPFEESPVEFADELVYCGFKKPSTIRLDRFEVKPEIEHPVICHFGLRPLTHSYAADPDYQELSRTFSKFRHQQFFGQLTRDELNRMVQIKHDMAQYRERITLRRDVMVEVDADGYHRIGLKSDTTQWALVLPIISHHVRHWLSLKTLDSRLHFSFKDRGLLALALTHPSFGANYAMNSDHARNTLTNCGVRKPAYGDKRVNAQVTRKKGVYKLFNTMGKQSSPDSVSAIQNYERLEFLGDAVLEYVTSIHLFMLFPESQEGMLTIFRTALVQNKHLATIAERLKLYDFMPLGHESDLHDLPSLWSVLANTFEAVMGAIFLEDGLSAAGAFFARHCFHDEPEMQAVWMNYPLHPLQQDKPCGDRDLIDESPFLQNIVKLEERLGIRFRHIRLLAKALTHPQIGYNNLTLGHNQRMEFLGDCILQFAVSQYLYRHFPDHHEGHLTLLRSVLVSNRCLAKVSEDLGLIDYIAAGTLSTKVNARTKLLGDLFEAFLAAVLLDRGMKLAVEVCGSVLFPRLPDMIEKRDWIDPKSKLQQSVLTLRRHGEHISMPTYRLLEEHGPSHNKVFTVGVFFQGKRIGVGNGRSLQDAEMEAAGDALESRAIPRLRQMQSRGQDRSMAYPHHD